MLKSLNTRDDILRVALQIQALSELFDMSSGEPPISLEGLKGVSIILSDLYHELNELAESIGHLG